MLPVLLVPPRCNVFQDTAHEELQKLRALCKLQQQQLELKEKELQALTARCKKQQEQRQAQDKHLQGGEEDEEEKGQVAVGTGAGPRVAAGCAGKTQRRQQLHTLTRHTSRSQSIPGRPTRTACNSP